MATISAVKCDRCEVVQQMPDGECVGYKITPYGWVTIIPMVRISGSKVKDERKNPGYKLYQHRRDKLSKLVQRVHYCEDCVEEFITGGKVLKLGDGKGIR